MFNHVLIIILWIIFVFLDLLNLRNYILPCSRDQMRRIINITVHNSLQELIMFKHLQCMEDKIGEFISRSMNVLFNILYFVFQSKVTCFLYSFILYNMLDDFSRENWFNKKLRIRDGFYTYFIIFENWATRDFKLFKRNVMNFEFRWRW